MIDTDYQMKRLCASLIHPESESGRDFWREVFALARERYGTASIQYSTFFRVWVVPDEIVIGEASGRAQIREATLKVLSEADYAPACTRHDAKAYQRANDLCHAAFKKIILPLVNKEVQEGANWIPLREVYHSLILAQWLKERFKDDPHIQHLKLINTHGPVHLNFPYGAVTFQSLQVPENKEYFEKYMDVFTRGVFYTVRDDYDPYHNQKITRVYFSGAIDFRMIADHMKSINAKG